MAVSRHSARWWFQCPLPGESGDDTTRLPHHLHACFDTISKIVVWWSGWWWWEVAFVHTFINLQCHGSASFHAALEFWAVQHVHAAPLLALPWLLRPYSRYFRLHSCRVRVL